MPNPSMVDLPMEAKSSAQRLDPPQPPPDPGPPGGTGEAYTAFLSWLEDNADEIIDLWVQRLSSLSTSYTIRPTSELYTTVSEAFRANQQVLTTGNKDRIDNFIHFITVKRLQAGFPLSDVQKAFELFRSIAVDMLLAPELQHLLAAALNPINECLAYTIHRFSDLFQQMAEKAIRSHAKGLERTVRIRTAELAESEQRYKTLVNEINDGYFIVQGERIAFANQAFARMHGSNPEALAGRPFADFVTPDCRSQVLEALRGAAQSRPEGGLLEYSRAGCSPEDAPTEMRFKVVELRQIPMTIGICRDISRRVAMENRLRENERMAYVGQIAASLSHEIRNPLSTCTLNMMTLQEKLHLDGFDRRRLEITVRELTRLEEILHQLLDMARPLALQTQLVDFSLVARDCVDLLAGRIQAAGVELRQSHPRELPLAMADFGKMEQALLNLMLNALESLGQDGRLIIWTRRVPGEEPRLVEMGVHDNGPGISPEVRGQLFTPFVTGKSRGTGLGLSIVKRIVEAHGGSVLVKSRPQVGTAFIMRLPCL